MQTRSSVDLREASRRATCQSYLVSARFIDAGVAPAIGLRHSMVRSHKPESAATLGLGGGAGPGGVRRSIKHSSERLGRIPASFEIKVTSAGSAADQRDGAFLFDRNAIDLS